MLLDFTAPFNRLRAALRPRPPCPPAPPDIPCPLTRPHAPLPAWVADDPVVAKYRALLGDLSWHQFPERATDRPWPGPQPERRAPFAAAYLVKLHEGKRWMSDLRSYLMAPSTNRACWLAISALSFLPMARRSRSASPSV